jgi:pimeloyl-ACP methyl ester carboxylesterase
MNRGVRRALVATASVAIASGAAVAAERYAVRRARSMPDPERGEPLAARPPERMTVTSFDGTELEVRIASPGRTRRKVAPERVPTLVFSHGFSLDMTTWHYQWMELSKRYRCVLYDLRGHGGSSAAREAGYTIEALGRDLRAVLDAAAPEGPVVLLGHSLGGMAILSLAEHHPEEFGAGASGRVSAVVLANTASSNVMKEALGDLAVRATSMVRRMLGSLGRRPALGERIRLAARGRGADTAFLATLITNFAPGAPPSLVEHVAAVSSSTAAEVWPPFLQSILDLDLRTAIAHVGVPTLVVVGEHDRLTPPGAARALVAALPDGRLDVIEGAGHLAMLERHQRFTDAVGSFLTEDLGDDTVGTSRKAGS